MLPTIRQGCGGDNVKAAQYLTGYAARKQASGQYDAGFVAHVCTWQRNHNLSPDGVIGPKTWTKLAETAPVCSTAKNSASAAVCALQLLLGDLEPDGLFGSNTRKAVAAFQSAKGLKVDACVGIKTWTALITGSAAESSGKAMLNQCVHYLQWDDRWKKVKYSTHTSAQTIGNSGCGPTAMAQILATWIDPKITPVEMCALAVKGGFRTYDSGTDWGFFEYVFRRYAGFSKFIKTTSIAVLKAALEEGALAVCLMNANDGGFWTSGGHYITVVGYDDKGYLYANDPNKKECPRRQHQDRFKQCLKQAFIYWPDSESAGGGDGATKAIIDISKYQSNVDYDALKDEVSLVILRAACGSDPDTVFETHAKALRERGVPFGVYGYSYAGDEAKARDEAQKLVGYAAKFDPLFYVMDAEEARITNAAIRAFAEALRGQGAKRIGCYVAHNRYKAYDYDSLRSLFDFTWIPRYGADDGTLTGSTMPAYACDLWQYTSKGRIAGISGNVDMNVIAGTGKPLSWFLGGD